MAHRTQESAVFNGCTFVVKGVFRAWFRRVSNTEHPCPLPVRSGRITLITRRHQWASASRIFMGFLWHWHDWVHHCTCDWTQVFLLPSPWLIFLITTSHPEYLVGRGTSYFSSITKALLSFRQFWGCWYWVCKKLGAKSLRSSSSWWWTGNPGML